MTEEKVQTNEVTRKKSNLLSVLFMVLGATLILIVILGEVFKWQFGFRRSFWLIICGIFIFFGGMYLFKNVNQLNIYFSNNIFQYNFDYQYELAVYKNIGKYKDIKLDGKDIKKFGKYSEWKNHIIKWESRFAGNYMNYNKDKEKAYATEIEDFCRYLNKRKRNAKLTKEIATGVLIPVELGIIELVCGGDEFSMTIKFIYAVILSFVIMFIFIRNQYNVDEEEHFTEDVIEILNLISSK